MEFLATLAFDALCIYVLVLIVRHPRAAFGWLVDAIALLIAWAF